MAAHKFNPVRSSARATTASGQSDNAVRGWQRLDSTLHPDQVEVFSAVAAHVADRHTKTVRWDGNPEDLAVAVEQHRIHGALHSAIRAGAIIGLDGSTVAAQATVAQHWALRAETALILASKALTAEGIAHRVLKGCATAHLDHRSADLRAIGDVDLFVAAADLDQAWRALQTLEPEVFEFHPGDPHRLFKGEARRTSSGVEIDLHTRLHVQTAFGPSPLDDPPQPLSLGGTVLPAAGRSWRLLHAAGHTLLSRPGHRRLNSCLDPAVIAPRCTADELAHAAELAFRLGTAEIVSRGLQLSCALSGVAVPAAWWSGPRSRVRRPVRLALSDRLTVLAFDRIRRRMLLEQLPALLSLPAADAARLMRSWVFPSASYRRALVTERSILAHLRSRVRQRSG